MPEPDLVTVATFLHRGEAEVARARLADAGLTALVIADDEGGLNPGFFRDYTIRLVVQTGDDVDAAQLLAEAP